MDGLKPRERWSKQSKPAEDDVLQLRLEDTPEQKHRMMVERANRVARFAGMMSSNNENEALVAMRKLLPRISKIA
jgi:hypothetical protein